jgi:uncharacterized protein (TIGR03067 family)
MKKCALFFGAFALFLIGCASPTERDQQAILGSWRVIRMEMDGERFANAQDDIERHERDGKSFRFQFFENGTLIADNIRETKAGTYELDAEKNPKWMTLTAEGEAESALMLYHLEGDRLRIGGFNGTALHKARPAALSDKGIVTMTLQREKP